jgi:hypothetical protein
MRKLHRFIVNNSGNRPLSVDEMQSLFGGSGLDTRIKIYACACYLQMECGCVFTKYVNVKATTQSAAETGVLNRACSGYTSASCHFLSNIDGTH